MSEETTTAVFNLEVVMLACEGKLSLHEENHACTMYSTWLFYCCFLLKMYRLPMLGRSQLYLIPESSRQHKSQRSSRSVPIGYYQVLLFRSYDMQNAMCIATILLAFYHTVNHNCRHRDMFYSVEKFSKKVSFYKNR